MPKRKAHFQNENRGTTIADGAKAAGVSVPTVSRILNNKEYVADETRQRVHHFTQRQLPGIRVVFHGQLQIAVPCQLHRQARMHLIDGKPRNKCCPQRMIVHAVAAFVQKRNARLLQNLPDFLHFRNAIG